MLSPFSPICVRRSLGSFVFALLMMGCDGTSNSAGELSGSYDSGIAAGTYSIRSRLSGKCLDIVGGGADNGTQIQQWSCYSGKNQGWRLIGQDDTYQIKSLATGKCLDIAGWSRNDGLKIQQWDCGTGDNQKFRFEDKGGGNYAIVAKSSGKALDISDRSKDDGARIQQWAEADGDNQLFTLEKLNLPAFVHTEGTRIVDKDGKDLPMKGMNLGNWLIWEGYLMMGDFSYRTHSQFLDSLKKAFGCEDKAREFERQWRLNYVDERAIKDLHDLGYNSVRVPFHHNMFWKNGRLTDEGFEYFDRVIGFGKKYGIYVLLDMHAAPGYQNPGDHSDNVDSNASQPRDSVRFWDGDNVDIAARIWKHIADRYKNEPAVWGYDLFNEPVPQDGREYELLPSLIKIRNAIREVDQNHIIVAEASWWASDLSKINWLDPQTQAHTHVTSRWDDNLVYQIHHYGAARDAFGRESLTNCMGIPLILGEFGENDNDNLKQTNAWAKSKLAGVFLWSFKKLTHDRTLWTIPTNDKYEAVKTAINQDHAVSDDLYKAILDFAKNNIRNGQENLAWHGDFYQAVSPK